MYLMLCRSSIYFFSCMLNTLIFTVDSYIMKKNNQCTPRPVTIAIVYSLDNTISIYHTVKCSLSYYIIQQFRKNLFFC